MKYFFNVRRDNTRYRLAEGFLLCFGKPLVCRTVAPATPQTGWGRKPPVSEAIKGGH
ncbi:conserved hypothetical protein [Enterobacterales bacterium 8AC]|nr:conserved hypothetical protein [Enterobacterales bacterium 8AC]